MAEFTKLLVTDRGSALVMKALQGKGIIRFTRLAASSRQYQEEDIKGLTSLEDIRQQGDISEMDAEGSNSIRLRVALPNIDLIEGYYIRTVGLYANDPDEGEILYGVSMETSAGGCYVPAYNHQIVSSLYFHISVAVGNAEVVSLEVDAGALVTRKQLDAVQQRITDEVKVLQEGMEEKADGTAFDNYKSATDTLLGNADITGIGDGTVTGAIRELNTGMKELKITTIAFANDTEMMDKLNNILPLQTNTWYRLIVAGITGISAWPIGDGFIYYVEGFKANQDYEWQKATSYSRNTIKQYARSKMDGTWNNWTAI